MKLEDIMASWSQDANIDTLNLGEESLRTPKLHSKYYQMFIHERMALKKLEIEFSEKYQLLFDWMDGVLSREELQAHGLEPYLLKRTKADIEKRLQTDPRIIEINKKILLQREKIEFIESILKMISNRGFQIKNAIDFMKFQAGSG
jgi:hypothetical protein